MTTGGARIGWDAFGDARDEPILLIQGLGAQLVGWRPGFCERLAAAGFYVVRLDNRDVGLSERYPQGGYALTDLADDAVALLDALGRDSAHVVGQSMGGMVAQLLWARHRQRVRSLGLLYTTASARHYCSPESVLEEIDRPAPRTRAAFATYYADGEAFCGSPAYAQDRAWLTELGGIMWDRGWEPSGATRQVTAVLFAPDRLDLVPAIDVPTVIIAGDGDQLIHAAASEELHALITGSTLKIFPGMGHELPRPLWDDIVALLTLNARRGLH